MEQVKASVIAVVEYENVYAAKLLRIGDEVIMRMDKEARHWGRKGPVDGTKGRVMGFFDYLTTYNHNRKKNPGIYRGNVENMTLGHFHDIITALGLDVCTFIEEEKIRRRK